MSSRPTSQDYEITIGIECHVQLATKTKLFSPANNDARDQDPNTCVSPIDYALPGMLPLLNAAAVKLAERAGHAMNCEIHPTSHFDRKHYFYPDLPKGYQISQFFQPIIGAGHISLPDGSRVRIEHAHLEEDAGKLTHYGAYSLVDLNRAGTPLLEIVSQPDIHSARQAAAYCKELWRIMTYAGVTLGDLYQGNMRFDINISVAKTSAKTLGTRTEIKNLNSFRSVERAVEYEAKRQIQLLTAGEKIKQETRGWSDDTGKTTPQRSKEAAADYRYMPEPDIPPLELSPEFIAAERTKLPTMPSDYRKLFSDLIPTETTEIILDYPHLAESLSAIIKTPAKPALILKVANLFTSVLLAEENTNLLNNPLPSTTQLLDLVTMHENHELSSTATKEIFLKLFTKEMQDKDTRTLAKELNLLQENDTDALAAIIDRVLKKPETQQAQADYRTGETKALGFLVGQVMKESKGKANPSAVQDILKQKLS